MLIGFCRTETRSIPIVYLFGALLMQALVTKTIGNENYLGDFLKQKLNNQMKYHVLKLREKRVLEVGAGTGLASLIAARCGASR